MAQLVPALLAEIPREGPCLEIGIGTGRIALPLTRAGVSIVGVDLSRGMLGRLQINAGASRIPVAVADATRLPFRSHTFASAIAAHVFHLIPNWTIAVEELLRVLRPGGTILASRGGRSPNSWERNVRQRFFVEAGDPPWPPGIDRIEELDEHMQRRGAAVRALPELSVEGSSSIIAMIANLEAGYFSGCWSLDEPTRTRAAAQTRKWAQEEFGELDEVRSSAESSVWRAYIVPSG
jgi:SAM-dependent methyltransferase